MKPIKPIAARDIQESPVKSAYPEPFISLMKGRVKRKLGDYFSLANFGINLTELSPGAMSALKHHHLKQDEFIYIVSGAPTLVYGNDEYLMNPGECFGFKSGEGIDHQIANRSNELVVYLEVGDRTVSDIVEYPDDDLIANFGQDGSWTFLHKDGSPY